MTGPPGPPGGAPGGGTWASWSIRRCSNSWLARRSPNSSALALGNAVINATAAVNPPSAATVPIFRLLVIGPPKTKITHAKDAMFLSTYDIARVAAFEAQVVRLVVFSSLCGYNANFLLKRIILIVI